MFFTVSEPAHDKILEYLETSEQKLRIKVVGGGCSGLRYELMLDDCVSEDDTVIDKVIVDQKSALYLTGSSLEYTDTIMESGFKILNPNATNTCGCGDSFSY